MDRQDLIPYPDRKTQIRGWSTPAETLFVRITRPSSFFTGKKNGKREGRDWLWARTSKRKWYTDAVLLLGFFPC